MNSQSFGRTRSAWYTNYRMARLVRGFERTFMEGGASTLAVAHFNEWMATFDLGDMLQHSRRNGRFGVSGKTKRFIAGPNRSLPA